MTLKLMKLVILESQLSSLIDIAKEDFYISNIETKDGNIHLDLIVDSSVTSEVYSLHEKTCKSMNIRSERLFKEHNTAEEKSELETLLELSSKYSFMLVGLDETSRGIGKTSKLAEIAKKEDLLILCGTSRIADQMNVKYSTDRFIHAVRAVLNPWYFSSRKYNGFLVDDCVSKESIELFKSKSGLEFKGGFSTTNYF